MATLPWISSYHVKWLKNQKIPNNYGESGNYHKNGARWLCVHMKTECATSLSILFLSWGHTFFLLRNVCYHRSNVFSAQHNCSDTMYFWAPNIDVHKSLIEVLKKFVSSSRLLLLYLIVIFLCAYGARARHATYIDCGWNCKDRKENNFW